MKRNIALLPLVFLFSFLPRPETGIKATIYNLRNDKGHVLVSLYKDGQGFPDEPEKAIRKAKLSIKDNQTWVMFTGLPPGNYAIAILHDENDDLKMNKNFFGLPKEGYGFSNNVMGTFGPPSFSRASFSFNGSSYIQASIKAKY